MADVELRASGVTTVQLPFPGHSKTVDTIDNQTRHRSAGGTLYTVKHGPTLYQVERKWELLTDAQQKAIAAFFETIGNSAGQITYVYTPSGGSQRSVPCRIIDPPKCVEIHRNNWEVTIKFEQSTNPNRQSDPAA